MLCPTPIFLHYLKLPYTYSCFNCDFFTCIITKLPFEIFILNVHTCWLEFFIKFSSFLINCTQLACQFFAFIAEHFYLFGGCVIAV